MVRRVMLGREMPAQVEESNAGTSVGRWEADTLVIETSGLNGNAPLIGPIGIGSGARTIERIRLAGPDVLELQLEMTAPGLFSDTFRQTYTFRRDRNHEAHESIACAPDDRSFDYEQRRERLEVTPPEDLPPPPGS